MLRYAPIYVKVTSDIEFAKKGWFWDRRNCELLVRQLLEDRENLFESIHLIPPHPHVGAFEVWFGM